LIITSAKAEATLRNEFDTAEPGIPFDEWLAGLYVDNFSNGGFHWIFGCVRL
jgi:hypothetical protein